ncbi:hypothetical protein JCGZ_15145 [Jatropha curcas]|uniref:UV-B-induced protein n=1 Tax=Jatropha curcas TaxID=180498 RepID=A0A067LKR2_JATCU|nr:UV-B-induced protein At3g17800, chloroplastic [Jatropha curcas]KDP45280.1 hypothetical protein JCGZ_15145 [Jatropha curcas]
MDYCLSTHKIFSPHFLPSTVNSRELPSIFSPRLTVKFADRRLISTSTCLNWKVRPAVVVVARAGSSHCEPSSSNSFSLNTPLEPRSAAGKFLSSVFQNQRQLFHVAVAEELKLLADDRDGAVSRMLLSSGSDEASLHRRIAQLKEQECQIAVEDVMYMLIFSKFSEIRVPLVPKLSRCIYNGRLEIGPSKDWELESIHSFEVLEMIREHVSTVIGLRANSSVTDTWATTEIQRLQLGRLYVASILYGYFLKSASLRHYLELCLAVPHHDVHLSRRTSLQLPESSPYRISNLVFGHQSVSSGQKSRKQDQKRGNLRCYVMGFDAETLQRCAKLKSKEAVNLIEKHSCALFGDDKAGLLENDEVILTSFSSLKRLILEAVAFGSFLWDTEEYVNSVFKLNEN